MPPDPVPIYADLDSLVADLGDRRYAHPGYTGDDRVLYPQTIAARVVIDGHRCIVHADCWVSRLRDLAAHIRRGGEIHYVPAQTLTGVSDRPGPAKDHLYVYVDDTSSSGAARKVETQRFQCPGCFESRPVNQLTAAGLCIDCAS